jgi:prepilin-type N-terminal cleavage/methylation domain-containing protein
MERMMKTAKPIGTMRSQRGFTLVEIAIVLVIIGLLLGGVLKGQELVNSARVKSLATDFRNIPLFIYGYQDRFRVIPGDDRDADDHVDGDVAANVGNSLGNGVLDGNWDSVIPTEESVLFWQHVRLADLAVGTTSLADMGSYFPQNAMGGRIGIESGAAGYVQDTVAGRFLQGTYVMCSQGILGRLAQQLDTTMDDGNGQTGNMRIVAMNHVRGGVGIAQAAVQEATPYIVCMGA